MYGTNVLFWVLLALRTCSRSPQPYLGMKQKRGHVECDALTGQCGCSLPASFSHAGAHTLCFQSSHLRFCGSLSNTTELSLEFQSPAGVMFGVSPGTDVLGQVEVDLTWALKADSDCGDMMGESELLKVAHLEFDTVAALWKNQSRCQAICRQGYDAFITDTGYVLQPSAEAKDVTACNCPAGDVNPRVVTGEMTLGTEHVSLLASGEKIFARHTCSATYNVSSGSVFGINAG